MPRPNNGPYLTDAPNENGFFEIRWSENGRSKRKSTGESDYRRAQRVFAEFILALEEVRKPENASVTCAQVIDAYVSAKTGVASPESQRITFGHLRAWFGELAVAELTQKDADDYVAARGRGDVSFVDAAGKTRGGTSARPQTVRRELTMLSTAVNYCVRKKLFKDAQGRVLLGPAAKLNWDLPEPHKARTRWLRREEAGRFLNACLADGAGPRLSRVYRYAAMMLYTAARSDSVVKLTWDRIDLEQKLINFAEPGRAVTKKRRGWVPIATELLPILQRAHRERTSEWFLDRPVKPQHGWARAAKAAGVKVSPHDLRRTWATWAAQDGVSMFEIAGVLHDSVAMVEKHYAIHAPNHLRNAVNRMVVIQGGKSDVA